MSYKIEYTTFAEESINLIYDYIRIVLSNPIAAKNTLIGITKTINELVLFPYKNRLSDDEELIKYNVRIAIYKKYKILYKIYEDDEAITIMDIYYEKMNISNTIFMKNK